MSRHEIVSNKGVLTRLEVLAAAVRGVQPENLRTRTKDDILIERYGKPLISEEEIRSAWSRDPRLS